MLSAQITEQIIIGCKDSLFSQKLNKNRELIVYIPKSPNPYVQSETYPLLYFLMAISCLHKQLVFWNT